MPYFKPTSKPPLPHSLRYSFTVTSSGETVGGATNAADPEQARRVAMAAFARAMEEHHVKFDPFTATIVVRKL